jgi:hypothetical protein
VTVGNQSSIYSCKDVGKLCEYEPLPTLTITAGTGVIGGGKEECPVWYKDMDGDGYTDGTTEVSCKQPTGYVSQAPTGDCNDGDSSINPGRAEICDSKDNNCNGQIDEGNVCAKVAAGGHHTCAIKTNGSLWCWGYNWYGQLGDGTNTSRNTPVQIISSGVSYVAAGGRHTCAIKQDGSLWCWGDNYYSQLGDGTNTDKNTPVYIMSLGSGGGGGAPSVFFGDKSSFDNREEKQANMGQKQTIYGCSSANVVSYIIYLIFPAFILFALRKVRD